MRNEPKLTPIFMLAIVITALTASSAFAQTEPELHNQAPRLIVTQEVHAANDVACPAVTPSPPPNPAPTVTAGGCRLHFSAPNAVWTTHFSGGGAEGVVSICNIELDVRLDGAGEGYITHQEFTQGTEGFCTRRACAQTTPPTSEGRAYTVYLQETEAAGQGPRESMVILLCYEALDQPGTFHCEITVPPSQPTEHRYRFTAFDVSGHGSSFPHCEFTFNLDSEAVLGTTGEGQLEQNVEIRHN